MVFVYLPIEANHILILNIQKRSIPLKSFGNLTGKITASFNAILACSNPTTSSNETSGSVTIAAKIKKKQSYLCETDTYSQTDRRIFAAYVFCLDHHYHHRHLYYLLNFHVH